MLQTHGWEVLQKVRTLLYKFANYTNVVGGEQYTTLSLVIPGADLGLNFWEGTDDVGVVISGCGQLSLHGFFLRSQNFEV